MNKYFMLIPFLTMVALFILTVALGFYVDATEDALRRHAFRIQTLEEDIGRLHAKEINRIYGREVAK